MEALYEQLRNHLGSAGRMISGSKSGYRNSHPDNCAVFNANIIAKNSDGAEKVWFGDIDITLDEQALKSAALDAECELYVLREMDARFENESNPKLDKFVYKTDGENCELGPESYAKRNADGIIVRQ